jgi:hypothetical protein
MVICIRDRDRISHIFTFQHLVRVSPTELVFVGMPGKPMEGVTSWNEVTVQRNQVKRIEVLEPDGQERWLIRLLRRNKWPISKSDR